MFTCGASANEAGYCNAAFDDLYKKQLSELSEEDPKAIGAQLRKVGATCKDCHKSYRVKK